MAIARHPAAHPLLIPENMCKTPPGAPVSVGTNGTRGDPVQPLDLMRNVKAQPVRGQPAAHCGRSIALSLLLTSEPSSWLSEEKVKTGWA